MAWEANSDSSGTVYNAQNQVGVGCGQAPSLYDCAGNQLMVNGDTLRYDAENRQVTATEPASLGSATETYAYDALGERVAKMNALGEMTAYVYDAFGRLAAEYGASSGTLSCSTCYLTRDHLGSVRLVTNESAQVVARHDYLPFGEEIPGNQAGRPAQTMLFGSDEGVRQKFTGQERDVETGEDYFQARYFSAGVGRFLSPDPGNAGADLMNPQTWNGYAYAAGNPLALVDVSGESFCDPANPDVLVCVQNDPQQSQSFAQGYPGCVSYGTQGCIRAPVPAGPPGPVTIGGSGPGGSSTGGTGGGGAGQQPPKTGIGIRNPGQSFRSCMQQHANDYNIGGGVELLADLAFNGGIGTSYSSNPVISFFTGDAITSLAFGSTADASSVAANAAPGIVRAGMGAVTTYGRRTSTIMSLNIPPLGGRAPGGLPQALGQSGAPAALQGALSRIGSAFSLGLKASTRWALDAAFTGAEMVNCSMAY